MTLHRYFFTFPHKTKKVDISPLLFVFKIKFLSESFYTTTCINKLLLSCVEGMALGANFNCDVFLCGTCFDYFAASTLNCGLLIIRMNSFSHLRSPLVHLRRRILPTAYYRIIITQNFNKCKNFFHFFEKIFKGHPKVPFYALSIKEFLLSSPWELRFFPSEYQLMYRKASL